MEWAFDCETNGAVMLLLTRRACLVYDEIRSLIKPVFSNEKIGGAERIKGHSIRQKLAPKFSS
jgi:hypothetical protein